MLQKLLPHRVPVAAIGHEFLLQLILFRGQRAFLDLAAATGLAQFVDQDRQPVEMVWMPRTETICSTSITSSRVAPCFSALAMWMRVPGL